MAYMSQQKKAALAPAIKAVMKKYGVKGTIAVRHHSTLVVNIQSGKLDMIGETNVRPGTTDFSVNPYWLGDHHQGDTYHFLVELKRAMMTGNHDNSDVMTDYFCVGWYIDINVGSWNKPYIKTA